MGDYLNPGSKNFIYSLNSKIYVDKTDLIRCTNAYLGTQQRYMCVSRPRRFGKTMGLDMLAAYYSAGTDSHGLFQDLKISKDPSYEQHINRYDVIRINIQEFVSMASSVEDFLSLLSKYMVADLTEAYEVTVTFRDRDNLIQTLKDTANATGRQFVFLFDEWDCLFREYKEDTEAQKKYLDFLRLLLKDQQYVALAYMTGILPVKKYGTHSALNMFTEFSMTDPRELAPYFGFTEDEVRTLCSDYGMSFEEARSWYDGYELSYTEDAGGKAIERACSVYSPKSMVDAMLTHHFGPYWNRTETYEALKIYIQLNYDGLKECVIRMLSGDHVPVDTGTFTNDMTTFSRADDVLSLLIHLGYLNYDRKTGTVSVPNREVAIEYVNAIQTMDGWGEVMCSLNESKALVAALITQDAEAVAEGIDRVHDNVSILTYNDENSLSCTIQLAFFFAQEYYTIIRELPAGKGFADICFIPRRLYADKPAVIIELKKEETAEGAIAQIKEKRYTGAMMEYKDNLLLCGINYDRKKKHTCVIERYKG